MFIPIRCIKNGLILESWIIEVMNVFLLKLSFLLAVVSLSSCGAESYPSKVTVKVVDQDGEAVTNANVGVSSFRYWDRSGQGFGKNVYDKYSERVDDNGVAVFECESKNGELGIRVDAEGYYHSSWPVFRFDKVVDGRWHPHNPTVEYMVKKRKDPTALYAKTYLINHTSIPKKGEACGYDFEIGDWVAPYGKGGKADIVFYLEVERDNGVNDHDCTLKVTFSNEGDGFVSSPAPLKQGSELRLDYLAPQDGFSPLLSIRAYIDPAERVRYTGYARTQNYFLRVRTKLNENGEVIRANYAKVHGDFEFWHTGDMKFTYYFNPTPNDRNLEFDPKKNLFTDLKNVMKVAAP